VRAMIGFGDRLDDTEVIHVLTLGVAPYAQPKYAQDFRPSAFFIGNSVRDAVNAARADYPDRPLAMATGVPFAAHCDRRSPGDGQPTGRRGTPICARCANEGRVSMAPNWTHRGRPAPDGPGEWLIRLCWRVCRQKVPERLATQTRIGAAGEIAHQRN
jgi:hypothetical protein